MGMGHRAGARPVPQHWAYVRAQASEERRPCENLTHPARPAAAAAFAVVTRSPPQHTHSLLGGSARSLEELLRPAGSPGPGAAYAGDRAGTGGGGPSVPPGQGAWASHLMQGPQVWP